MSSYDRRVKHYPVEVRLSEGLKDHLPAPLFRPAVEALIDGVVLAEALREVFPGSPGVGNPKHGVEKAAVVVGVAAGIARLARKQGLKSVVLLVGLFIASSHSRKFEDGCQTGRKRLVDAGRRAKMPRP